MDSVSQLVLGAAVGEATLGKKVGNRAILWGAIAGTIPDLDVLAAPFLNDMQSYAFHRGISHSIFFCVLMAPVLGWLIHRLYQRRKASEQASFKEWSWLFFWGLFTHPLLDCFTSWGTQLFLPFSDYRVAFNSIFVADPIYTLPFLITVIITLSLRRSHPWRPFWNKLGLTISCLYLGLTLVNKQVANQAFENAFHERGSSVLRYSTYPSPLNNILWYVVAEEPDGYRIGYFSLWTQPDQIDFLFLPKDFQFRREHENDPALKRLRWFSNNYYIMREYEGVPYIHDLRFGVMNALTQEEMPKEPQYVFHFQLEEDDGEFIGFEAKRKVPPKVEQADWDNFVTKIFGE